MELDLLSAEVLCKCSASNHALREQVGPETLKGVRDLNQK